MSAGHPAIQDGADFYDDMDGELIVSYPEMVRDCNDMAGAVAARARFGVEYPDYWFPGEDE